MKNIYITMLAMLISLQANAGIRGYAVDEYVNQKNNVQEQPKPEKKNKLNDLSFLYSNHNIQIKTLSHKYISLEQIWDNKVVHKPINVDFAPKAYRKRLVELGLKGYLDALFKKYKHKRIEDKNKNLIHVFENGVEFIIFVPKYLNESDKNYILNDSKIYRYKLPKEYINYEITFTNVASYMSSDNDVEIKIANNTVAKEDLLNYAVTSTMFNIGSIFVPNTLHFRKEYTPLFSKCNVYKISNIIQKDKNRYYMNLALPTNKDLEKNEYSQDDSMVDNLKKCMSRDMFLIQNDNTRIIYLQNLLPFFGMSGKAFPVMFQELPKATYVSRSEFYVIYQADLGSKFKITTYLEPNGKIKDIKVKVLRKGKFL
ncbi:MAG TPA: hypothetical protein DCL21_03140 [Alphaproteobacteria bacterium]|nr:hypothetical protein [Alphaproteobacteria bacterium]